jgi:hypothetical protein
VRAKSDRLAVRVQEAALGSKRGVVVEIDHSSQRRFLRLLSEVPAGGSGGVVADQVMHGVSAARLLGQQ